MKNNNFYYVVIIIIGLVIAGTSFISTLTTDNTNAEVWLHRGVIVAGIAGVFMLLMNGTFIRTRYFNMLKGVFAILVLGALVKMMHWGYDNILMTIGFAGIVVVYFLSFQKKPVKKRLDYLKLAFVIVTYVISILDYLHFIGDEYNYLSKSLLWLAVLDYLLIEKKAGRLFYKA